MARKNQQTTNEFLLYTLNLELTNRAWSWDANGEDVVVLKLWEKQRETLPDGTDRIEVWSPPPWRKPARIARNKRRLNIDKRNEGGTTTQSCVAATVPTNVRRGTTRETVCTS
jgi:hypothetical protein